MRGTRRHREEGDKARAKQRGSAKEELHILRETESECGQESHSRRESKSDLQWTACSFVDGHRRICERQGCTSCGRRRANVAKGVIVDERACRTRSRHCAIWRDATEARERPGMSSAKNLQLQHITNTSCHGRAAYLENCIICSMHR